MPDSRPTPGAPSVVAQILGRACKFAAQPSNRPLIIETANLQFCGDAGRRRSKGVRGSPSNNLYKGRQHSRNSGETRQEQ